MTDDDNHAAMIEEADHMTTTVLRQIEDDLRAAFPEVDFDLFPYWPMRRSGGSRWIEISWCGDPPEAVAAAVTGNRSRR